MSKVLDSSYFIHTQNLLSDIDPSRNALRLYENQGKIEIGECIGKEEFNSSVLKFCEESGLHPDRVFSLIDIFLFCITAKNRPKIFINWDFLYTGQFDFSFVVEDFLVLLKNKRNSYPRRDTKVKAYVPVYKETKVLNRFGILFDPKTELWCIRYHIYPQKKMYGFRYIERFRDFSDLIEFLVSDITNYANEDTSEVRIVEDMEEDLTFEDEM